MISILNIKEVKRGEYDDVWAIVRYYKGRSDWIKQVTELSPSQLLWARFHRLKLNNNWNRTTFEQVYLPAFLEEMKTSSAKAKLNELYSKDRDGKRICLVCFCADESLCHRSIIAGLLQGVGCSVKCSNNIDYSSYYEQYRRNN